MLRGNFNDFILSQDIKCYPYELATDLKLMERNEWLKLIAISS